MNIARLGVYTGDLQDERMHGSGTLIYRDKITRYEGHFKNDMREGTGVLTKSEKTVYDGEW